MTGALASGATGAAAGGAVTGAELCACAAAAPKLTIKASGSTAEKNLFENVMWVSLQGDE
jgi:hypothetical protein